MRRFALAAIAAAGLAFAAQAGETPAPEGAEVYFINIKDGDTVSSPVLIQFGARGVGVAPAGVEKEKTGHHHLLIDATLEGEALGEGVPSDENHRHFGGGQTEVSVELSSGSHTLQLIMGDHNHIPHDPPIMSEVITITVE